MNLPLFYLALFFFASLSWQRKIWGLYLILLLLPSYLLRTQIWLIPTTWLELAIYILFLIWLIQLLIEKKLIKTIKKLIVDYRPAWLALVIWLAAAGLAVIISPNLRLSAGAFKGWWFDPLLFTILLFALIQNTKQLQKIIWSLLGGGLIVATYGLLEYIGNWGMQADGLLNSFYKPANYVALYLAPIILLGLSLLKINQTNKQLTLKVSAIIAPAIIALWYTQSYGGGLGLGAGLFIFFLWQKNKNKRRRGLIIIIIAGLLALGAISTSPKFQRLINGNQRNSLTTRLQIWEISLTVLKNNYFWGVGLGNFQQPYRQIAFTLYHPPLEWEVVKAHNLYLNIWLEMGISGLIAFGWLLASWSYYLKKSLTTLHLSAIHWWLLAGSSAALTTILVHGLVDTPYFKNDLALIFMAVWSLPAIIYQLNNNY